MATTPDREQATVLKKNLGSSFRPQLFIGFEELHYWTVTIRMFDTFRRYWRRRRGIRRAQITLDSVSEVHRDISEQAVETSFAVFIVPRPNQDSVEVQFSIENGTAGLDWILESEANKAERRKVEQYISSKGFHFQEKEMNNWHYLRVEQGDIAKLCVGIIRDIYGSGAVVLKYRGFKFRPFSKIIRNWITRSG